MDYLLRPALAGKKTGWFAPTYRHLAASWRDFIALLGPVGDPNKAEKIIQFPNGGSIEFWSLDSVGPGRSRRYAAIVIDEAAHAPNLREQFNDSIRATLADDIGSALFCSTPNGRNFFYELFLRGQDPLHTDWKSFQYPTSCNPFISADEIAAAKQDLPDLSFQQEWLGEFVEFSGAVFHNLRAAIYDVVPDWLRPPPTDVHRWLTAWPTYAIGLDVGRSHDWTAAVVLAVDQQATSARGELCTAVAQIDRFRGEYAIQHGRLMALWNRWNRPAALVEQNSIGQPVLESLVRSGMHTLRGFQTNNSSKSLVIQDLALAFEKETIKILPDPVLLGECANFEATLLPSGLTRYAAPGSAHDDTVIALALALHCAKKFRHMYDPASRARTNEVLMRAFGM